MEEALDKDIIYTAKVISVHVLVNLYAVERVAFGYEKPGDKAPVDLYLEHLGLERHCDPFMRSRIPGPYIDEQERISTEHSYEEYVRELFVSQTEHIFRDETKDEFLENEAEDLPFPPSLREYLFGLLPLFTDVMKMPVDPEFFDIIRTEKQANEQEYEKRKKLVTETVLKKSENEDYRNIFALFSLMKFMNFENNNLLEFKMLEWERRNDGERYNKRNKEILRSIRRRIFGE